MDVAGCKSAVGAGGLGDNVFMATHLASRRRELAAVLLVAAALPGCVVVSGAGSAAGAAISIGGAVVSSTVKVAGKVVEKTIDLAVPGAPPAPPR